MRAERLTLTLQLLAFLPHLDLKQNHLLKPFFYVLLYSKTQNVTKKHSQKAFISHFSQYIVTLLKGSLKTSTSIIRKRQANHLVLNKTVYSKLCQLKMVEKYHWNVCYSQHVFLCMWRTR